MADLKLVGISKRYTGRADVTALQPVDLTVGSGEFITILGPSGCGKTTLLNIISGLLPPTTGRVYVGDRDITACDPRERDMAMVFQNYALYPSKTVRGNLEFPLRIRRVPPVERRARVEALALTLGLGDLLDQLPRQLSGGQQQRVALGRALIRQPQVFLMDEPLSNLDAKLRLQMRSEIKRLHRQFPITTIYVTHDQAEAMSMSDRVVVMNHGVIVQVGTPEEVYDHPVDRFVAEFVGSVPMNMIAVRLRGGDGTVECVGPHDTLLARLQGDTALTVSRAMLGVRPRDVSVQTQPANDLWLSGRIEEVEDSGDDSYVQVALAEGLRVVARVERSGWIAADQRVWIRLDPGHIHVFDDRTGRALPVRAAAVHHPA